MSKAERFWGRRQLAKQLVQTVSSYFVTTPKKYNAESCLGFKDSLFIIQNILKSFFTCFRT